MQSNRKIYIYIILNIIVFVVMFKFVLPKMANSLVALQNSHQAQISKLNQLNDQLKSLSKMNEDLSSLNELKVKPENFFTSDATLVNEIKSIEDAAVLTNTELDLAISGTADKAKSIPSLSNLVQVPFTMALKGAYPNVVRFVKYMENRYFIAPISSINISADEESEGTVIATFQSNFYLFNLNPVAQTPAAKDSNAKVPVVK